ncbi:MAG TPA: hypothetical protein VHX64_06985 [Caulobacteraceae bacterium]|nr:hypothetical protein [Caulobacteraceae bacterium]
MDLTDGKPNLFEKIGALFGLEGSSNAAVLAGDERDLSTAEKDLLAFAGPILSQDASAIEDSLLTAVKGFLPTLGTITSVPAAAAATKAFITTQGGALLAQVESMAEAVWQAFVALAIHAVGLVVPPAAA